MGLNRTFKRNTFEKGHNDLRSLLIHRTTYCLKTLTILTLCTRHGDGFLGHNSNAEYYEAPEVILRVSCRVSTGIPGYGLHMEMMRNFFSLPLWKRFQKSGILERFFFRKPKISGMLFRISRSLRNSRTFRKNRSGNFQNNWYQN